MYGGKSRQSPQSYCKITTYLRHHAETLHENIEDLCLFGLFKTRGRSGVTLLLPDKKLCARIDKMVGTNSKLAVDMIKAHVLPVYMGSIGDFKDSKDDIPNLLGNKLPIKDVTGSIVLENGAKITKVAPGFERLYDDARINIFLIESSSGGEGVPVDSDKSSKQLTGNKRRKKGGYTGGSDYADSAFLVSKSEISLEFVYGGIKSDIERRMKGHLKGSNSPLLHAHFAFHASEFVPDYAKTISKETRTGHMTDILFDLAMPCINDGVLKNLYGNINYYNDSESFKNSFKSTTTDTYYTDLNSFKQETVRGINGTSFLKDLKKVFNRALELKGESLLKLINEAGFDSPDAFINWWIMKCEFAFYFSARLASAISKGDELGLKDVKHIFHIFNNYYKPCLVSKDFKDSTSFVDILTKSLGSSVQNLCVVRSFLLDISCAGSGHTDGMGSLMKFAKKQKRSLDERPNTSLDITSSLGMEIGFIGDIEQVGPPEKPPTPS